MTSDSRFLSVRIDRPAKTVYEYAADVANLREWVTGIESDAQVTFAPRNDFGVLDHEVRTPAGETVYVPMRVTPHGEGAEVVFTLRPFPGMTAEELERDSAAVMTDLNRLKEVLEAAR
jgi:hypothetical protein